MDNQTWELRNRVRVETLRELATLTRAGIPLTTEILEEMAHDCERARMSLDLISAWVKPEAEIEAYPTDDPKHPEYHSTHADIHDMREGK